MATVSGLRSVGGNAPRTNERSGRTQVARPTSTNTGLSPSAGATGAFRGAPAVPNDNRLGQLADALSELNPALQNYSKMQQEKTFNEQKAQIEFFATEALKAQEDGLVTKAQLKEIFPEMVPQVAMMVKEAIAAKKGKEVTEGLVESILNNDTLRLDSEARRAHIQEARNNALEAAWAEENPFYASSYLSQFDRTLREWENRWMSETASYHENLLTEDMSDKVRDALLHGGDLLEIDATFDNSSLNKLERKEIVVSTAINQALADENPEILKRIPDRFLNANYKQQLKRAGEQIETARWTRYSRARQAEAYERDSQLRNTKHSILQRMAAGEFVSPAEYANDPDAFAFATSIANAPMVNPAVSSRNSTWVANRLAEAAVTGDFGEAFREDPYFEQFAGGTNDVPIEIVHDYIMTLDGMNPADKAALVEKSNQYMEAGNFTRDPDVTHAYGSIAEDIRAFSSSTNGFKLATDGFNLNSSAQRVYNDFISGEVLARIEDGKGVPVGAAKREIIRAAQDHTNKFITNVKNEVGLGANSGAGDRASNVESEFRSRGGRTQRAAPSTEETTNEEGDIKVIGGRRFRITMENGQEVRTLLRDDE